MIISEFGWKLYNNGLSNIPAILNFNHKSVICDLQNSPMPVLSRIKRKLPNFVSHIESTILNFDHKFVICNLKITISVPHDKYSIKNISTRVQENE